MRLVQTTDLAHWSDTKFSEGRLPYFLKQLIGATVKPDQLRFPSGDAISMPGFDGMLVVSGEGHQYVPKGISVWESGTEKKPLGKADRDYDKRTAKFADAQTTFVFVTSRKWSSKEKWLKERREEGKWKDVVALDAVELQDWIEFCPAVNLQFASELKIVPEEGLQFIDQAWESWSDLTRWPASEELAVVGREEQEQEFLRRLTEEPGVFTVRSDSPREALGFALAALRRVPDEQDRLILRGRTIVADDERVASRLRHHENLVILLRRAHGQVSGNLSRRGCHVIIPEGNDARSENVIKLPRPTYHAFAETLQRMGVPDEDAERAARTCGRSLTIFQRREAHANFELPEWAKPPIVNDLLPAIMAGRWSDRNEADRNILCRLSNVCSYENLAEKLEYYLHVNEPPLQKIGDLWTLVAPPDAFHLAACRLPRHLGRFEVAFREVFGRLDPKVEISPDEWLYHDAREGEAGHSGWLRSGLAETLLLISERGADAGLECDPPPAFYADAVVRGLPGLNDDWRLLASLRDQFPRLLESAPRPLLASLERLLEAQPDDLKRLFTEGGLLGGGAMHTGLLWGLEALAWIPEYLPRVALVLARLASIDPGGRMTNRPINSLRSILSWARPGTNAPTERRNAALDLVLERSPDIGWALLAKLLPGNLPYFVHTTAKPRWRDVGDPPTEVNTRQGQREAVARTIDQALERLGTSAERWRDFLPSLRVANSAQRATAITCLREIGGSNTPAYVTAALWETLRDFVHRQRTFQEADWVLRGHVLDELEDVLHAFSPKDPVERHRWLFDEYLPDLPSSGRDINQRRTAVRDLRHRAIEDILSAGDVSRMTSLGTLCRYPGLVAMIAVPMLSDIERVACLLNHALGAGERGSFFASTISGQARRSFGESWFRYVLAGARAGRWLAPALTTLVVEWPDERATWDEVAVIGAATATEYWRKKRILALGGNVDDRVYQIERLVAVGRAVETLEAVSFDTENIPSDALITLFSAAMTEINNMEDSDELRRILPRSHDVKDVLDTLRKRDDVAQEMVARLEYLALPLLGLDKEGLVIHGFMAKHPDFFMEVICDVFLPANRERDDDPAPTPEERARAQVGYELLESMHTVPGYWAPGEIDGEVLLRWIEAVRARAAEVDRLVIADLRIGDVLAHAPDDPEDKAWPHRAVRDVFEKNMGEDVGRGLMTERHNMRGVYTKAIYEGGVQERALAQQYRDWAEASRRRWPKMAAILDAIADSWECDGRREDERAEQSRWRFD